MNTLHLKVKNAPHKPGVYIYKNNSEVIYVGKAKNLFKRVSSYFNKTHSDMKTASLVQKIDDVDFTVTSNEVEALILESNLIKKYKPAYNISFRDDKSFPFLAITTKDEYPRITITREAQKDGALYFGPYTNVRAVRSTLDMLRKIFPLRTCRNQQPGRKGSTSPCLNFHIKRCLGPCSGKVPKEEYTEVVNQVVMFLDGKIDKVIKSLEKEMKTYADDLNFEEAARIRNRISSAKQIQDSQKVVSQDIEDFDVLGTAESEGYLSVTFFAVRSGKLLASENFNLDKGLEPIPLASFIKQFYKDSAIAPGKILVPQKIAETEALENWLTENLKKKIIIHEPQRGRKKRLIEMANENAGYSLGLYLKRLEVEAKNALLAAKRLEQLTGIENIKRIECYDVSNISGTNAVASMVVFKNGLPSKDDYRKFKIKKISGIDDYAMLAEALDRRLKCLTGVQPVDLSFSEKPDLILIDGGSGQLSAAVKTILKHKMNIKAVSIAKKEEELYIEGKSRPVKLVNEDPALFFIQRIRDEAHRFAVTFHRQLRSKQLRESALDNVEGIGEQKKKALINKFGSVENIKKAGINKLKEVPGISDKLARDIKASMKK
jgi:excinuclease ABC subunit C